MTDCDCVCWNPLTQFLGGLATVFAADWRLAMLGLAVKTPLLTRLQHLASADLRKYNFLYSQSRDGADALATKVNAQWATGRRRVGGADRA